MMYVNIYLIILTCFFCNTFALDIGDICELKNGDSGTCELLSLCPAAVSDLVNKLTLVNCGFDKSHPIVCCKNNQQLTTTSTTESIIPTTVANKQNEEGDKCISHSGEFGHYQWLIDCPRELFNVRMNIPASSNDPKNTLICCEIYENNGKKLSRLTQSQLGESCTLDSGVDGKCEILTNCESAIVDLFSKIPPTICNTEGKDIIVCCAPKSHATMQTKVTGIPNDLNLNRKTIGDSCVLHSGGNGKCELITLCQQAISDLNDGIFPIPCGTDLNLICCNPNSVKLIVPKQSSGDSCVLNSGENGSCEFLAGCKSAILDLNKGISPTHCGLDLNLVCCNLNAVEVTTAKYSIGDICVLNSGENGECDLLTNCKPAISDLSKGIPPIHCGSDLNLICCDFKVDEVTTVKQSIGDSCVLNSGESGQCDVLTNCKSAISDLGRGVPATYCASDLNLICCNVNAVEVTTSKQSIGDSCVLNSGESGQCDLLTNCKSAISDLSKGISPTNCESDSNLICCNSNALTVTTVKQSIGDACVLKSGDIGQCDLLVNCSPVISDLSKGIPSTDCESDSNLICCNHNAIEVTTLKESIGDNCVLNSGKSGQCELFTKCKSAISDLSKGIAPTYCGSDFNLICCNPKVVEATTPKQSIGDTCVLSSGENGTCKLETNCDTSMSDFQKGILPIHCKSDESNVICCSNESLASHIGSRAYKKCLEYGAYVYEDFNSKKKDRCGIKKQVTDGKLASAHEFPHMASIGYIYSGNKHWTCNGVLISEEYVLTSAICDEHPLYGSMKYVRIGSIDLHSHANCVQEFDVSPSNFISHPNFTFDSRDNDIALIKLNKPVKLTPYVRPACLYTKDTVTENKGVASGWSSNNMHSTKNPLYKITLNMDLNGACDSMQLDSYEVTQDMALNLVCAKRNGASKACSDDVGIPLQVYNKDNYCMYDIIGVGIYGDFCNANTIGVFTRISSHLEWIENIVWP